MGRLRLFLQGYVVVRLSGENLEGFANLAARRGVRLVQLARVARGVAVARLPAGQYRALRLPARRSRVQVRVVARGGLPFVVQRLRRRPSLLAGFAVAVGVMAALGSRVWEVRVSGPPGSEVAPVREALARLGLRPGVPRRWVQPTELERSLLLQRPELAWAEVRLQGSTAVVEVRPRRSVPLEAAPSGDIVASADGLVTELQVQQGWAAVRRGEVVRRGQVLISGRQGSMAVRAAGWVRGRVWSEGYGESRRWLPLFEGTGQKLRGWTLRLGSWRLALGQVEPPRTWFRHLGGGQWRLPGAGVWVPLELEWVAYEVLRRTELPVGLEQARRLAEEQAMEQALSGLGPRPDILRVERRTWEEDLGEAGVVVRCRVLVEAVQDLGTFREHGT
ncbi:MAG TPA: sporulation protein YqfD [Limnochordales bacterium]